MSRMRNAEFGMRNGEFGMRKAECGMRNTECGLRLICVFGCRMDVIFSKFILLIRSIEYHNFRHFSAF
jgi:hypothetical protein